MDDPNSDMQDIFGEDNWDGLFDDDAPVDEQFALESVLAELEDCANGDGKDGRRASSSSEPTKRRRSGREIEREGRGLLPPPYWHSEAADRPHRLEMIAEVGLLLQSRKKTNPSLEWLRQLPHKARKLEERLYRSATSLESYLDKSTLKTRLKTLARVITKQFMEAKARRGSKFRSSETSFSTVASFSSAVSSLRSSSLRSSVSSVDSLRSLRESLAAGTSLASLSSSPTAVTSTSSSGTEDTVGRFRFSIDSAAALKVIPEAPFSGAGSHNSSESNSHSSKPEQQQRNSNSLAPVTSGNVSEIERQKAINEQLQKQILEYIRQQASSSTGQSNYDNNNSAATVNHANSQPTPQAISSGGCNIRRNSDTQLPNSIPYNPQSGTSASAPAAAQGNSPGPGMLQQIQCNQLQIPEPVPIGCSATGMPQQQHLQQLNPNMLLAQAALFSSSGRTAAAAAAASRSQFQPQQQQQQGVSNNSAPAPGLVNAMMALNNRNMLKQSFLQACQTSLTQAQAQQFAQQLQLQQSQNHPFFMGSAAMQSPNPVMAAAAADMSASNMNMKPVIAGPLAAAAPAFNLSMPPPADTVNRTSSVTQLSLQQAARAAKSGFEGVGGEGGPAEPLSPGSFNW